MVYYNQHGLKPTPQLMFNKVMQLNGASPLLPHSSANACTKKIPVQMNRDFEFIIFTFKYLSLRHKQQQ
jgi:hypothetical protein